MVWAYLLDCGSFPEEDLSSLTGPYFEDTKYVPSRFGPGTCHQSREKKGIFGNVRG
jgi:hypothetical protein